MTMQPLDPSAHKENQRDTTANLEEQSLFTKATAVGTLLLSLLAGGTSNAKEDTPSSPVPAAVHAVIDLSQAQIGIPVPVEETLDEPRTGVVIPDGVTRAELTKEAKAWLDLQVKLSENTLRGEGTPKLVDGTTFVSKEAQDALKRFVGQSDSKSGITFKAISEEGYKFAFETKSGDTWYVSEATWYHDQFPRGISFTETSIEIWKKGSEKLTQKEFKSTAVFYLGYGRESSSINFEKLQDFMKAAEDARASELKDTAGVRPYKFSNKPTGYIALVDGSTSDPIMAGGTEDAKYFPQVFNSLKGSDGQPLYNLVVKDGSDCIVVKQEPQDILRTKIKAMYEKGIRQFYLNFVGHGNDEGVYFHKNPFIDYCLTPQQLHSIFSQFKDCDFVVDTIACDGAGMAPKMKAYEDPSDRPGRILMKLQAKPSSYNQEGRIEGVAGVNGEPKVFSSYYQIFNVYYLNQGLNFGEAHYQADLAAKKFIPCDAEAWVSSPKGGRATLDKEQQEKK